MPFYSLREAEIFDTSKRNQSFTKILRTAHELVIDRDKGLRQYLTEPSDVEKRCLHRRLCHYDDSVIRYWMEALPKPIKYVNAPPLAWLLGAMNKAFDAEEFKTLCFDLEISQNDLSGERTSARMQDLIEKLCEDGRIDQLIEYCREKRPNENWNLPTYFLA